MSIPSNLRKSIFHLQQSLRTEYPNNPELNKALDIMIEKLHAVNLKEIKLLNIQEIARTYHDREVCSMFFGEERDCPICTKKSTSLISIEHDSQDFSKDLSICIDCYTEIHNLWKTNAPKKICPV